MTSATLIAPYRAISRIVAFAAVGWLILAALAFPAHAATTVPYTDSSANGAITLCDAAKQPITSGNIHDHPFSAFAVGSTPAPQNYRGNGETATLFAYQPIKGVDAFNWYGHLLTFSGRYSNPTVPMLAGTSGDLSLSDYLSLYPTMWNGLVQLRIYVGFPHLPTYYTTYNTATIQISGDKWTLLTPTKALCDSGAAVSDVVPVEQASATAAPRSAASTSPTAVAPSAGSATGSVDGDSETNSAVAEVPNVRTASSTSSSASGWPLVGGAAVIVLLAAGGGGFWWRRRLARTRG